MINFVSEKTIGGFELLLHIGSEYNQNAQDIHEDYVALEQHMKQLEQDMDAINRVAGEVNTAVDENTRGITHISEIAVNLKAQIQSNQKIVIENEGNEVPYAKSHKIPHFNKRKDSSYRPPPVCKRRL